MKPIRFSKVLGQSKTLRLFRLALAAPAFVITVSSSQAGAPEPAAPAETPELTNSIGFTVGGAFVSGDEQGFMRSNQTNGDFYGGISELHYEHSINDTTSLTLDGHAMPGLEDYEFGLLLNKEGLGYLKFEYDQFRTWYDASGGYFPGAGNPWVVPFDDERYIDRGEFSMEAGLRMENLPEITFRYSHSFRDGEKDSTCWGDNETAKGFGTAKPQNTYRFKNVPALWQIDEQVDTFELDIEHTVGNTDLGLGLVYEHSELTNTRITPRGGALGSGATATTGYSVVSLTEGDETDVFASHIYGVTRFNDRAWLSYAAAYNKLDSDISGSREYNYGTNLGVRDYQYNGMSGGSNMDQYIANVNFMWVPIDDLTITPAVRYEHESVYSTSRFTAFSPVDLNGNGALTKTELFNATTIFWKGPQAYSADTDKDSTTAALDLRYTGISDLVLYAKAEAGFEDESIMRVVTNQPTEWLGSDIEVDEQEFSLGANWYPLRNLSFAAEGLYALRDQSLDHRAGPFPANSNTLLPADVQKVISMPATTPAQTAARNAAIAALPTASLNAALAATNSAGMANNLRPIMVEHETETSDLNLRATWRPLSNLSLVTRYDYCEVDYENKGIIWSPPGNAEILSQIQSGEVTSHILSESVTWTPLARMYVQGTVSWISSETTTPDQYVGNSDNDAITAGVSVGYAIDNRTDITASYSYYNSRNYVPSRDFSGVETMGYGFETSDHMISLTLRRMITENMLWNVQYGFVTSNTDGLDQSGGYNDFDAHMVSTGLQIRF